MSRSDLNKYLSGLSKSQLEDQIIDLYHRFKDVKVYYDFAFNPNEKKLLDEAKFKIGEEYFPVKRKKVKRRLSVAQKLIKHFITIGVEPTITADLMIFNIELAQTYSEEKEIKQIAFYRSILKSFQQVCQYISQCDLQSEFSDRLNLIVRKSIELKWINASAFKTTLEENDI